jgi:hypothetical protein
MLNRPEEAHRALNLYYPAFYSSGAASMGEQKLVIFTSKEAVSVPLPFVLNRFTYAPDGKALYAQATVNRRTPKRGCLYKIEFNPIRSKPVPGTCDLTALHSITVSSGGRKVLVSGGYRDGLNRHVVSSRYSCGRPA